MASYPGSVYDPRTKENKEGVIFTASDSTRLFAEDVVGLDEEVVAIETQLLAWLDQAVKEVSTPTFAGLTLSKEYDGQYFALNIENVSTGDDAISFVGFTNSYGPLGGVFGTGENYADGANSIGLVNYVGSVWLMSIYSHIYFGLTQMVTILNTGNVGIGTNNPLTKLNLSASLGAMIRITATKSAGDWAGVQSLGGFEIYSNDYNDSGPGVKFAVNCENMGDDSGGEYGSDIDTVFRSASRYGGEGNLLEWLRVKWTGDVYFNFGYLDKNVQIRASSSGVIAHFDAGKANVGIGTDNPTAKLEVNGGIAIVDGMTAPATISGYAQIYVDTSDGDLKIKFGDGTVKTIATDS